jgi:hypothetical protein
VASNNTQSLPPTNQLSIATPTYLRSNANIDLPDEMVKVYDELVKTNPSKYKLGRILPALPDAATRFKIQPNTLEPGYDRLQQNYAFGNQSDYTIRESNLNGLYEEIDALNPEQLLKEAVENVFKDLLKENPFQGISSFAVKRYVPELLNIALAVLFQNGEDTNQYIIRVWKDNLLVNPEMKNMLRNGFQKAYETITLDVQKLTSANEYSESFVTSNNEWKSYMKQYTESYKPYLRKNPVWNNLRNRDWKAFYTGGRWQQWLLNDFQGNWASIQALDLKDLMQFPSTENVQVKHEFIQDLEERRLYGQANPQQKEQEKLDFLKKSLSEEPDYSKIITNGMFRGDTWKTVPILRRQELFYLYPELLQNPYQAGHVDIEVSEADAANSEVMEFNERLAHANWEQYHELLEERNMGPDAKAQVGIAYIKKLREDERLAALAKQAKLDQLKTQNKDAYKTQNELFFRELRRLNPELVGDPWVEDNIEKSKQYAVQMEDQQNDYYGNQQNWVTEEQPTEEPQEGGAYRKRMRRRLF